MRNKNSDDISWFSIVFPVACVMMQEFLANTLYIKILIAMMILVLIYSVIKQIKITIYGIRNQNTNIQTWISVKVDYWLMCIKNIIAFSLVLSIGFSFLILSGKQLLIVLLFIAVFLTLVLFFEHKFESKTEIYNEDHFE